MHHASGLPGERLSASGDPTGPSASIIPLTASRRRRAFLRLAAMNAPSVGAAFESASFSRGERALWASSYPEEVRLVNGELPWIALALADLD